MNRFFKNKTETIKFFLICSVIFYLLAFVYIVNGINISNALPII